MFRKKVHLASTFFSRQEKEMTTKSVVEKWCKQRKYCWSLPLSAFFPAIEYDNWFRDECAIESYKYFAYQRSQGQKAIVKPPWSDDPLYEGVFCSLEEEQQYQKEEVNYDFSRMICLKGSQDIHEFTFDVLDLNWTWIGYEGPHSLCYDFDEVCNKIAKIQVTTLESKFKKYHIDDKIMNIIADMIVESFSIEDVTDDDDDVAEKFGKLPLPKKGVIIKRKKPANLKKEKRARKN